MDRDTTDDVEQELGVDRVKVMLLLSPLSTIHNTRTSIPDSLLSILT